MRESVYACIPDRCIVLDHSEVVVYKIQTVNLAAIKCVDLA